ncbi:MAG: M56 family metallopeptidase [Candidatus Sumerlaeota bacterium]|nr:M56 family metallopeptidase [Candidatus Sumerlaeota bacterium]
MNRFLDIIQCWPAGLALAPAGVLLIAKAILILALGWLLHGIFSRANPRWRVLLWRMVTVGLAALPLTLWVNLPIRLRPSVPRATAALSLVAAPYPATPSSSEPMAPQPILSSGVGPNSSAEPAQNGIAQSTFNSTASKSNSAGAPSGAAFIARMGWLLPGLGLALWLVVAFLLLMRWFAGMARLRLLIARHSTAAPAELNVLSERVAVGLKCRSANVRLSARVSTPVISGILRPVLLLPPRMAEASYRGELAGIIAHELSHVRSGDLFWTHCIGVMSRLLWFHPLAWPVLRAHTAACEEVSDAISAAYLGDTGSYIRTLARVALDMAALHPPSGAIAMARVPEVMRRLDRLRRHVFADSLSRRSAVIFLLLGAAGMIALSGWRLAYAQKPNDVAKPIETADSSKKSGRTALFKVVDADGRLLPGANLTIRMDDASTITQNAEDGTARFAIPSPLPKSLHFEAKLPGYVTERGNWCYFENANWNPSEYILRMDKRTSIGGTVRNEAGQPIKGAKVFLGSFGDMHRFEEFTKTLENGSFQFDQAPQKKCFLAAGAPGCAPEIIPVTLREKNPPLSLQLSQGRVIQGKVVDERGRPIKETVVYPATWRNISSLFPILRTDAEGRFRWDGAPDDAVLFSIGDGSRMAILYYPMVARAEDYLVTVRPRLAVSGRVVDDETGQAVPSFKVFPGFEWGDMAAPSWMENEFAEGANGEFRIYLDRPSLAYCIQIEAGGYKTSTSPEFLYNADGVICSARLKKDKEASFWLEDTKGKMLPAFSQPRAQSPLGGRIVYPSGQSHKNLPVYQCFPRTDLIIRDGAASAGGSSVGYLFAQEDGRLDVKPPLLDAFELVSISEWGYAHARGQAFIENPEIPLKPWGRVEGVMTIAGKAAAGLTVRAEYLKPFCDASNEDRPKVWFDERTETSQDGRFVFAHLMDGPARIKVLIPASGTGQPSRVIERTVEIKSGQTARADVSE